MNAVNEENFNHYFDLLQEIFELNNFAAHPKKNLLRHIHQANMLATQHGITKRSEI